jgi:hypothetical protein
MSNACPFSVQGSRPVELIHHPGFSGGHDRFPHGVVLRDFIRGLKFTP